LFEDHILISPVALPLESKANLLPSSATTSGYLNQTQACSWEANYKVNPRKKITTFC
jgi:hypothetical protein